jgi:hypothetical protein
MGESRQFLTRNAYAKHRGKSRQYISRLAEAGVLVMRGKLVDVAASDAVLDDHPERIPVPAASEPQVGTSYAQARLANMVYQAKLKHLEYGKRRGKLHEDDVCKTRWSSICVQAKERALAVPDKLAPELVPITDERQMRDVLKREMYDLIKAWRSDVQNAR